MSIRVLGITGCRSDYDLVSGLYARCHDDADMELGLIVCGAHLANSYGLTVRHIEQDGLPIVGRILSLLESDTSAARIKSAAICLQSAVQVVESFKPDVILYQGDREEVLVGAMLGAYMKVPTIHFFSGDHTTDGSVDHVVRHAASKMSSLHFVMHDRHRARLIRIGESANRIFVIGSPQLDAFLSTPPMTKGAVLQALGRPAWNEYAVLIHHSSHGLEHLAAEHFHDCLRALRKEGINVFAAMPNSDPGSRSILTAMETYAADDSVCIYQSLPRELFVNLLRHARLMIGNSSAAIYEAPMIPLAAVNVGIRQRDRIAADNVLFVDNGVTQICTGIRTVLGHEFQARLTKVRSPYGDGHSIERAHRLMRGLMFADYTYKPEDPLNDPVATPSHEDTVS